MPALLQLDQATIRFGGLTAVNAVNFAVNDGELCGLIGSDLSVVAVDQSLNVAFHV